MATATAHVRPTRCLRATHWTPWTQQWTSTSPQRAAAGDLHDRRHRTFLARAAAKAKEAPIEPAPPHRGRRGVVRPEARARAERRPAARRRPGRVLVLARPARGRQLGAPARALRRQVSKRPGRDRFRPRPVVRVRERAPVRVHAARTARDGEDVRGDASSVSSRPRRRKPRGGGGGGGGDAPRRVARRDGLLAAPRATRVAQRPLRRAEARERDRARGGRA